MMNNNRGSFFKKSILSNSTADASTSKSTSFQPVSAGNFFLKPSLIKTPSTAPSSSASLTSCSSTFTTSSSSLSAAPLSSFSTFSSSASAAAASSSSNLQSLFKLPQSSLTTTAESQSNSAAAATSSADHKASGLTSNSQSQDVQSQAEKESAAASATQNSESDEIQFVAKRRDFSSFVFGENISSRVECSAPANNSSSTAQITPTSKEAEKEAATARTTSSTAAAQSSESASSITSSLSSGTAPVTTTVIAAGVTGEAEEREVRVIKFNCKIYEFDRERKSWIERGFGYGHLNDPEESQRGEWDDESGDENDADDEEVEEEVESSDTHEDFAAENRNTNRKHSCDIVASSASPSERRKKAARNSRLIIRSNGTFRVLVNVSLCGPPTKPARSAANRGRVASGNTNMTTMTMICELVADARLRLLLPSKQIFLIVLQNKKECDRLVTLMRERGCEVRDVRRHTGMQVTFRAPQQQPVRGAAVATQSELRKRPATQSPSCNSADDDDDDDVKAGNEDADNANSGGGGSARSDGKNASNFKVPRCEPENNAQSIDKSKTELENEQQDKAEDIEPQEKDDDEDNDENEEEKESDESGKYLGDEKKERETI